MSSGERISFFIHIGNTQKLYKMFLKILFLVNLFQNDQLTLNSIMAKISCFLIRRTCLLKVFTRIRLCGTN